MVRYWRLVTSWLRKEAYFSPDNSWRMPVSGHCLGALEMLQGGTFQAWFTEAMNTIASTPLVFALVPLKCSKEAHFSPDNSRGNKGDFLHAPGHSLPWCPWNASVDFYNFLIGCPLPDENAVVPLLSKMKYTGLTFRKLYLFLTFISLIIVEWKCVSFYRFISLNKQKLKN